MHAITYQEPPSPRQTDPGFFSLTQAQEIEKVKP